MTGQNPAMVTTKHSNCILSLPLPICQQNASTIITQKQSEIYAPQREEIIQVCQSINLHNQPVFFVHIFPSKKSGSDLKDQDASSVEEKRDTKENSQLSFH